MPSSLPPRPLPQGDARRWNQPAGAGLPTRQTLLQLRGDILREIRAWFHSQGFLEVDTPALVKAPSPEPQFSPLSCGQEYLITSPEFQLKRMLVGGFPRLYRLGPVFRGGEMGPLHNPEFTMLEWYRAGEGLDALAADLEALTTRLAPLALAARDGRWLKVVPGHWHLPAGGVRSSQPVEVDLAPPMAQVTVDALFRQHLGIALNGAVDAPALLAAARQAGMTEDLPLDFEQAFFRLWNRLEHRLGLEAPLLVTHWPAPLASLARLTPGQPHTAQRMEWLIAGVELANGFEELTDPTEQRRRFLADLEHRQRLGMPPLPLDERFLAALEEGLPPAAGMALGVDRLVMLLGGAQTVGQVMTFGWDER